MPQPSIDFDPYYVYLGVAPLERPPNHYSLLGVERFEPDVQVIAMAADRQMGHLQRYESGDHGTQVSKLMSEVSRARLCLLDPLRKDGYDAQLRTELEAKERADRESMKINRRR